MKYILKLLATSIIITTATLAQASTVNWEIKFFNENGNIVGDGEFSYDPDTLVSFSTESPNPSDIPELISVNTSFTNLNWRFGGDQLWNTNSARFAWWDGGSLIHTYQRWILLWSPYSIGDFSGSGIWSANALVPIPSTILLFGSGLFSLALAKRKKFQTNH